jgi:hypothetical protein
MFFYFIPKTKIFYWQLVNKNRRNNTLSGNRTMNKVPDKEKNSKKNDKEYYIDATGELIIEKLALSEKNYSETAIQVLDYITQACREGEYQKSFAYINALMNVARKKQENHEVFFFLIEGINRAIRNFSEEDDEEFLFSLTEILFDLLIENIEVQDNLAAICDSLELVLQSLRTYDQLDFLEESVKRLMILSLEYKDNLLLRTTAADGIIIAINGFGDEWNYEKTTAFGSHLIKLLPPKEVKGILASILIKGLSELMNCYGDMHEITAMKKTLELIQRVFKENWSDEIFSVESYAAGLVYAVNWFGEAENYEEMIDILNEIKKIKDKNNEISSVKISYANALRIALDRSGLMNDLDTTTRLANDLLQLADELPTNKKLQSLTIIGVFKAAAWAGAFWETGLILALLKKASKIVERFPDDYYIQTLIIRGLFNLTKELSKIGNKKVMEQIIHEIATIQNENPEEIEFAIFYLKALVNMTFMLSEDLDSLEEIPSYIAVADGLVKEFKENEELLVEFSKMLVNLVHAFGYFGKIDDMIEIIDSLQALFFNTENPEILIRLGKAYIEAIKALGEVNELEIVPAYLSEMKAWVEEDSTDYELQLLLCKALVNSISSYGKNKQLKEMAIYLDELKRRAQLFSSITSIQKQYAKGLTLAIRWQSNHNQELSEIMANLTNLKRISLELSDDLEIQDLHMRSIRRVAIQAFKSDNTNQANSLIAEAKEKLNEFPLHDFTQIEYGRLLASLIIECSSKKDNKQCDNYFTEFSGLLIQFPNNEKLVALHQTIAPLINS